MIGLDTNILVRYIAQDDAGQSRVATRILEQSLSPEQPGFVTLVALCELVWVLESSYDCQRPKVVEALALLLRAKQLAVEQADLAWKALRGYAAGEADFADALIAQASLVAGCERVLTFDKKAARLDGFELAT
jgi:predicted nucleic-acid-binding protein